MRGRLLEAAAKSQQADSAVRNEVEAGKPGKPSSTRRNEFDLKLIFGNLIPF